MNIKKKGGNTCEGRKLAGKKNKINDVSGEGRAYVSAHACAIGIDIFTLFLHLPCPFTFS